MGDVMHGLVLGEVTDVDDPEGLGRIRVAFMNFGSDVESVWAPVAATMAGAEAGVHFLPEVGDIAVVGFLMGGLNHPVVLGYVWNGDQAPPSTEPTERRIVSREGHSVTFFDGGGDDGITLEDAHGNKVVMKSDGIEIETPGNLAIKVSGNGDIECSGTLTLKGATIQLNP
ncbi:phage baseplate assembly protein V [Fluviibacterium sp. DFM31]|uniref:Phage baseplate assembly protein V n=1 Tax=Meridianimarinicoccus marinus TaxID=3231483 RepID=A0ABV3L7B5_9RHOB